MDGVNAADQMGDQPAGGGHGGGSGPFFHGGFPGGGGGNTRTHHHFTQGGFPNGGGGGGGGIHMSDADAQQFFAQFFGHSDPFGGGSGHPHPGRSGRSSSGHPRMTSSMGGAGGHHDPFSMFAPGIGGGGMPMGGSFGGHDPFQQQQRRSQVNVKRYDAIPNGTPVSLKGLLSQPERNGDRGEVVGYDANAKRYTVLLEDTDDEKLRVKPDNLLQHVHVRLHNIESQPSLNGQQGTIIAWDGKKERYNIYIMDLSKVMSLKPSNVILQDGTVAQIVNLTSKPELNQQFGTIKSFIQDSSRYDVQLSEQQVIRIKLDNVRV